MHFILRTENLSRHFKSGDETIKALNNVNITVEQKKLTILRGRSGSGKTTLINLLGAMDKPTSGKVYIEDKDITTLKEPEKDEIRRTSMGFVFQSGALMNNMTIYENLDFALRISSPKLNNTERKERILQCLTMVGLENRYKHFPSELSGGEIQRIAISRAISHRPKIIFADEPTSALDTLTGIKIVKIFKNMVEQEDVTVIMTTHDPNMLEIADKVYTLQDGETVNE